MQYIITFVSLIALGFGLFFGLGWLLDVLMGFLIVLMDYFLKAVVVLSAVGITLYLLSKNLKYIVKGYFWFRLRKGAFIGKPGIAVAHWRFQTGNTCAINAQRIILAMCGVYRTEHELASRLTAYNRHSAIKGSSDLKLLMEGYGLDVKQERFVTKQEFLKHLFVSLSSGRLALIGVNSETLNDPDPHFATGVNIKSDHAIVVTALHNLGNGVIMAYYMDSGISDGIIKKVDYRVLKESSANFIVQSPVLFEPRIKIRDGKVERLDEFPIDGRKGASHVVRCPECSLGLRVKLSAKTKVTCPRCEYTYLLSLNGESENTSTRRPMFREVDGREQASAGGDSSQPDQQKPTNKSDKFVTVSVRCKHCNEPITESLLKGPSSVFLQCAVCKTCAEYPVIE